MNSLIVRFVDPHAMAKGQRFATPIRNDRDEENPKVGFVGITPVETSNIHEPRNGGARNNLHRDSIVRLRTSPSCHARTPTHPHPLTHTHIHIQPATSHQQLTPYLQCCANAS